MEVFSLFPKEPSSAKTETVIALFCTARSPSSIIQDTRALNEQSKNRSFDAEPQVLGKTIFFAQLVARVQLYKM